MRCSVGDGLFFFKKTTDGDTIRQMPTFRQAAEFVAASGGTQQNGGSSTANGGSPKAGGGSILDDESEGGGGILGDSELADAMDGVALDETKLSKVRGGAGGGGGLARGQRDCRMHGVVGLRLAKSEELNN